MTFWFFWLLSCGILPQTTTDGTFTPVNPPSALACESHVDCVLSCIVDGECCDAPCGCTEVRSRTAEDALEAQRTRSCLSGTFECPIPECTQQLDLVPRCIEGQCAAVERPTSAR